MTAVERREKKQTGSQKESPAACTQERQLKSLICGSEMQIQPVKHKAMQSSSSDIQGHVQGCFSAKGGILL